MIGRKDRPGLDALLKAVARREFDMGCRLVGRSPRAVAAGPDQVLSDLHAKGVDLYLHHQNPASGWLPPRSHLQSNGLGRFRHDAAKRNEPQGPGPDRWGSPQSGGSVLG